MELVFPTIGLKEAALEYISDYVKHGEIHIHGSSSLLQAVSYESWLEKIIWNHTECTKDCVTGEVYFAMIEDSIVGTIAIRHYLNDNLLNSGGHIGYGVRPSKRRNGYGSQMLALALEKCKTLGMAKVLITCDKNNIASERTALKNGAVFENEFKEEDGNTIKRFWINVM